MFQLSYQKFFIFFIFLLFFSLVGLVFSDHNSSVESTIKIAVCGNDIQEADELCDGTDLAGQTCQDFGFNAGNLFCGISCDEFDTSACYNSGGGGGGGGGGGSPNRETKVIFSGRAYPLGNVYILKDGQLGVKTIASPDSNFYASFDDLSEGNYNFSVYGEDNEKRKSSLFTFSVFVTKGTITRISGIFIAPTIDVDKSEVKKGDNLAIFGQSVPDSEIVINVNSEEEIFLRTKSTEDGVYFYNFDTSIIAMGDHSTRSKAVLGQEASSFGKTVVFLVGTKNIFKTNDDDLMGDLNYDKRVNLVDFSIAAYWYKRSLSKSFTLIEIDKLNGDGKIDLTDFSIMAYYWTG